MAVVTPTRLVGNDAKSVTYTWLNMAAADTGAPVFIGDLDNISIQNTVATATAQIRASNDGANFFGLSATLTGAAAAVMVQGLQRLDVPAQFIDVNPTAVATTTIILAGRLRDM